MIKSILNLSSFLLLSMSAFSQSSKCYVYDDLTAQERFFLGISDKEFTDNKSNPLLYSNSFNTLTSNLNLYSSTSKKFRIKFWNVRNNNGTAGSWVSYEMAVKYVKDLNEHYKDMDICFVLTGVGQLYDDSSLNGKEHNYLKQKGIQNNAYDDNAINVYIAPTIMGGAHGITNYYSNSIALYEVAMWHEKGLLAHEVGHALTLIHTHGQYNSPPNGNVGSLQGCEAVTRDINDPNYNADINGDKVIDTAADPGLFANINNPNYNINQDCEYIGNASDCFNVPYVLDESVLNNFMAYNHDHCKEIFTTGQKNRVHYNIDHANTQNHPVKKALLTQDNNFAYDLFIRDGYEDYGEEPNVLTDNFWTSPDIWIRLNDDNVTDHQNPIHSATPNYVYVRVVNRGCDISDSSGKIKLYWTKAGTNLPLQAWDGSININNTPMGGVIGEINLPEFKSYEEKIFKFQWNVPNPGDYHNINEPWHFCLMAKIETNSDISTMPEITDSYYNYLNSNNLALKNVSITNVNESNSGIIHISNFNSMNKNYKINFKNELAQNNSNIFNEAEIRLEFDDTLWKIWENNNFLGSNYRRMGNKTIIVNENSEIILGDFPNNKIGLLNVKVNFLTDLYTNKEKYGFHVIQKDNDSNELVGGEYYQVLKNQRIVFNASYLKINNQIVATPIMEDAVYNWYNSDGNLLYSGLTFNYNNDNDDIILEVESLEDGFISYKNISNEDLDVNFITSIYPNPATSNLNVNYDNIVCENSYFSLVKVDGIVYDNYLIDLNSNTFSIDISNKEPGIYRLLMICDNEIKESYNVQIQ